MESHLYGFTELNMEQARVAVETALNVELELHNSSFLGGDYWLWESPDNSTSLSIRRNRDLLYRPGDPIEEQWAEPDHFGVPILLYMDIDENEGKLTGQISQINGIKFLENRR